MILEANFPPALENRHPVLRARDSSGRAIPRIGRSFAEIATQAQAKQPTHLRAAEGQTKPANRRSFSLWQNGAFSFGDLLDIVNPLQHIPIVATIYRNMSGDALGMGPRMIGGALWGRLGGLVSGVVNAVVEWLTGKDIGDHVYAAFFGDPKSSLPNNALDGSKQSPAAQVVREPKRPSAYPTSLPRGARDDGLRSNAMPDRSHGFSKLPASVEGPFAGSNRVLTSHYSSANPTERLAEGRRELRVSA